MLGAPHLKVSVKYGHILPRQLADVLHAVQHVASLRKASAQQQIILQWHALTRTLTAATNPGPSWYTKALPTLLS